ncbi:MAG: radical SAM protein [Candidatus Latescibacterota bacterium]
MKPVICNYYLTYRCNARCGFCAIWKDRSAPYSVEAPPDVVCRNLGDVRRLGVRVVDFTGGEPLLYEGLPRVLEYAKSLGLWTTVTTNGIRYAECARELAGKVDILQFSLHGPNRETHDAATVTPSFDRVMDGIALARSLGEQPSFIHTVTDENIGAVPEIMTMTRALGVMLFFNPCFPYFGNTGLSPENARELGRMATGKGITLDRGFLRFLIDGGNSRERPRCLAVTSTVVISPDDRLILPCFHRRTKTLPIGGRLFALRKSPEVLQKQEMEGRYPFCQGCAVNCYIRASLFRRLDRYFLPSIASAMKYLRELSRNRTGKRKTTGYLE